MSEPDVRPFIETLPVPFLPNFLFYLFSRLLLVRHENVE